MDLYVNGSESMRKPGGGNNPELTLSYLCDKDKGKDLDDHDHDPVDVDGSGSGSGSGVGAGAGDDYGVDVDDCVGRERGRDFMNLSEGSHVRALDYSSRRKGDDDVSDEGGREKRSKLGTLSLSLALPDASLSLPVSSALPHGNSDCNVGGVLQLAAPSGDTLTCSTDFTAPSILCSYSNSHLFSHNPSCSLTRNSTGNYEYSMGNRDRDNQIWYAGEGTNGSVHSRFKPLGDGGGVALADGGGSGNGNGISLNFAMQGSHQISRDCSSGFYQNTNSERCSYLPSELPAQRARDAISGDSRGKNLENSNSLAIGRTRKVSRPERIVREIVMESIPVMCQIVQELSEEVMESIKGYLRSILDVPEGSEELTGLQRKLDMRSDLTKETLSKCNKDQLLILVAVRTGLGSFLSGKNKIPNAELLEIFLFLRCRNVNCKMLLPVDDCECKFCSANRGFCSCCMCPVCLKFDCANNTCSWIGCDMCSHWCHASCGIQKNLIRPMPSAKSGAAEMHFFCVGCDHASEMYGFVKDVFSCCAKDWGTESLIKELDCVKKIFWRSKDFKGMELHRMAEKLLSMLETRIITPSDACNVTMKFFSGVDSNSAFSDLHVPPELTPTRDSAFRLHSSYTRPPILPRETPDDFQKGEMKSSLSKEQNPEGDFMAVMRRNRFDRLESMIKIKEVEARMFQGKADNARREAEGYKQMIQAKIAKLEGEYAQKLSDLCLHELEERRRKQLDELQLLENLHCDYQKMKMRMQSEIAGLLERMEATRKQCK